MINIEYKKYIEGSSPPYDYQVLVADCSCVTVNNGTGSLASDGFIEFSLSFTNEACIETCTVTLQVTDSKNCTASQELDLTSPCDDFVVGPISKLSDYSFTVPVVGGDPTYQYKWLYDQDIFTTLNDSNKTLNLELKPASGYPEQTVLYVTVTDSNGCKQTITYNISICQPIGEDISNYVRIPCEYSQRTPISLSAISCVERTIDWSTFTVTRIVNNDTLEELTEDDIKVYLEDTGLFASGKRVFEFVRDVVESIPGNYTFYWTVKDDLGIESEEAFIFVNVIPCIEDPKDPPVTDDCACNISYCSLDDNEELRLKLSTCIVSEKDCEDDNCIDPSTINIVSGPNFPGAVVYYDSFTEELVYIPGVDPEGVDIVEFTAETYGGVPTGLITWTIYLNCYSPPEVADDVACVECCETVNIDILANDTPNFDGGFDVNSIQIIQYPSYGTINILPDGTIDYTALCNTGGQSEDTFQYIVKNLASDDYSNVGTVTIEIICAGIDDEYTICVEDPSPMAVVSASLNSVGKYSMNFKAFLANGSALDTNDEYEVEVWNTTDNLMIASATLFIDGDLATVKPTTDNDWTAKILPHIDNVTLTAGLMQSSGVTAIFDKEAFAIAEGYANEFDDAGDFVGGDVSIDMKFVVRATDVSQPATSSDSEADVERVRISVIEDTNYVDQGANPDGNLACTWSWVGTPGTDSTFTTSPSDLHASQLAYTWFSEFLNPYNKPPGKIVSYTISGFPAQSASINYSSQNSLINAFNALAGITYFGGKSWDYFETQYNLVGNNALMYVAYSEYSSVYLEEFDITYLNATVNNGKRTNCILKHYILY